MASLKPDQQLLHFRVEEMIGHGGMGEVYKARDLKLGRTVALKVLPRGTSASSKARMRLLQEARSASALNHPNIVTIHSIENFDDMDFIVMEYVQGKKLVNLIYEAPLQMDVLLDISLQIADALAVAHGAGIIHRDIKAENVLIASNQRVKVLDFGLAKSLLLPTAENPRDAETIEQITEAGTLLGTVHYMSPEQVRGDDLDARTDIFSFGCLLYQASTGKLPFQGTSIPAVLYQVANVEPPAPSAFRKDLPDPFNRLVMRALAKNRQARFADGAEIAVALRNLKEAASTTGHATATEEEHPKSNLVGREQQIHELLEAFSDSMQGAGKTIFISGEAGIGKSALADDFLRICNTMAPHMVIARGRCVEQYGTAQAYLPFSEAIEVLLNQPEGSRLIEALRSHAPTWHVQFPGAFASTDAFERSRSESLGANKDRMIREFANALFQFSNTSPMLLFLEDLQWADPSSVDLLRYVAERLSSQRFMVLGTYRAEDVERINAPLKACLLELKSHHALKEIPLSLLKAEDIQKLIDAMFPVNDFSTELAALIAGKTDGHPLFVTSLLQFLQSRRIIFKQGDRWSLKGAASDLNLQVPESVSSMIQKKLDTLSEGDRKLLQYASVEGEEFSSTVLAATAGLDEIDLEEQLRRVGESYALLRNVGEEEFPDGSLGTKYRFTHALYQNALYAELVPKRRMHLHRMVGETLLKHYGRKAALVAPRLAEHFRLGRDFERALEFLTIAADESVAIYANAEAAVLYQKALDQISELQKRDADETKWKAESAQLHENLGKVLALTGNQEEARREFESALQKLNSAELIIAARLHAKIAKTLETERKFNEALAEYGIAEEILHQNPSPEKEWWQELLQLELERLWLYYTTNQVGELEALTSRVEPILEKHATATQRARFFLGLTLYGWRKDRYHVEERHIQNCFRFLEAAREAGNLGEIAHANFVCGFGYLWRGELDDALQYINEALALSQKVGDVVLQSRCWIYLAVTQRKRRDRDALRTYNSKALEIATTVKMQEYVAAVYANEAWLALTEKNSQEVKVKAEQALQIWSTLSLVYPFHGLALWPLISDDFSEGRYQDAIERTRKLLDPSQQRYSDSINSALESAVAQWDLGKTESATAFLKDALEIARSESHL